MQQLWKNVRVFITCVIFCVKYSVCWYAPYQSICRHNAACWCFKFFYICLVKVLLAECAFLLWGGIDSHFQNLMQFRKVDLSGLFVLLFSNFSIVIWSNGFDTSFYKNSTNKGYIKCRNKRYIGSWEYNRKYISNWQLSQSSLHLLFIYSEFLKPSCLFFLSWTQKSITCEMHFIH